MRRNQKMIKETHLPSAKNYLRPDQLVGWFLIALPKNWGSSENLFKLTFPRQMWSFKCLRNDETGSYHSYIKSLDFTPEKQQAQYLKLLNSNDTFYYNEHFLWKDSLSGGSWSRSNGKAQFLSLRKKLHQDEGVKSTRMNLFQRVAYENENFN